DPQRAGRALRVVGAGGAHRHSLLQERPEHQVEPDVSAQDTLGAREGRSPPNADPGAGTTPPRHCRRDAWLVRVGGAAVFDPVGTLDRSGQSGGDLCHHRTVWRGAPFFPIPDRVCGHHHQHSPGEHRLQPVTAPFVDAARLAVARRRAAARRHAAAVCRLLVAVRYEGFAGPE
nr:hypothetical protein [Tanacetum cinerariifolium]